MPVWFAISFHAFLFALLALSLRAAIWERLVPMERFVVVFAGCYLLACDLFTRLPIRVQYLHLSESGFVENVELVLYLLCAALLVQLFRTRTQAWFRPAYLVYAFVFVGLFFEEISWGANYVDPLHVAPHSWQALAIRLSESAVASDYFRTLITSLLPPALAAIALSPTLSLGFYLNRERIIPRMLEGYSGVGGAVRLMIRLTAAALFTVGGNLVPAGFNGYSSEVSQFAFDLCATAYLLLALRAESAVPRTDRGRWTPAFSHRVRVFAGVAIASWASVYFGSAALDQLRSIPTSMAPVAGPYSVCSEAISIDRTLTRPCGSRIIAEGMMRNDSEMDIVDLVVRCTFFGPTDQELARHEFVLLDGSKPDQQLPGEGENYYFLSFDRPENAARLQLQCVRCRLVPESE